MFLIGSIPLRKLVYRVHELPPSMDHLVYDFGQLTGNTEDRYIWRIVSHFVSTSTTCVSSWRIYITVAEYISHLEVYIGSLYYTSSLVNVFRCFYSTSIAGTLTLNTSVGSLSSQYYQNTRDPMSQVSGVNLAAL